MKRDLLLISGLLCFGVVSRLLTHLPDATPLTAIALASATYAGRRWAVVVPIAAVFFSDALIGFYDLPVMTSVYVSWFLIGAMSAWAAGRGNLLSIVLATISASLLFFVVTNFAVWAFTPWYTKDLAGLMYCYELGLPFLRNMMIGDLIYTPVLLGAFSFFTFPARSVRPIVYAE